MEIIRIVPLVQEQTGWREFELVLDTGQYVYVCATDLLKYRKVQELLLRKTGQVYVHAPAEKRSAQAVWQQYVSDLMQPEVVIPAKEPTESWPGHEATVYSLERYRRQHREEGAA